MAGEDLALGIDFGTSGARLIALDAAGNVWTETSQTFGAHAPGSRAPLWQTTLMELLGSVGRGGRKYVKAIALNGTSGTVLLCDRHGQPVATPVLYNESAGEAAVEQVRAIAPPQHPVLSATSSLAKVMVWLEHHRQGLLNVTSNEPLYLLHQADWLGFLLHGQLGVSDYHNSLKLGYDVEEFAYPSWMAPVVQSAIRLPHVLPPGTVIGGLREAIASQFGFPPDCRVCAGTTDSIAAFLASNVKTPGEAVTSLGSTLVLKLLSDVRVDDARYGIYSHRLGNRWLVGGASNTGGAVLRQFFSDADVVRLSDRIPTDRPSPLHYYPLTAPGERFPIHDPTLRPCLEPRPSSDVEFLHGLLESMARIEAKGYKRLEALGATSLKQVYTAGGGAKNRAWSHIRARHLNVEVKPSKHTDAAYGTARLAQGSCVLPTSLWLLGLGEFG